MEGKERRRALRKERKEGKGANMKHRRERESGVEWKGGGRKKGGCWRREERRVKEGRRGGE